MSMGENVIEFEYTYTYEEDGEEKTVESLLTVPESEVQQVFDQALRGTLEGVDGDTLFTELNARSVE